MRLRSLLCVVLGALALAADGDDSQAVAKPVGPPKTTENRQTRTGGSVPILPEAVSTDVSVSSESDRASLLMTRN